MRVLAILLLPFVSAQRVATAEYLVDAVNATGARCLDGTPYQYWVDVGEESTKFVFDWQGGAWCQSIDACADRAYGDGCFMGSSSAECFNQDAERCANKTDHMPFSCIPACNGARWCGGLMQDNPITNPLSHNWTHVLFPYCDGGSAIGNNETVTYTEYKGKNVSLYFRGLRNLDAALAQLLSKYNLGQASEVLITGNSAGGLNTYYHMDRIAEFVRSHSPTVQVRGAPDSGNRSIKCERSQSDWERVCGFSGGITAIKSTTAVRRSSGFTNRKQERVVMSSPSNAAFITSCAEHCGQWAQGSDGDFNVTIDGFQAIDALQEWMKGGRKYWHQSATFPCNDCCHGGSKSPQLSIMSKQNI